MLVDIDTKSLGLCRTVRNLVGECPSFDLKLGGPVADLFGGQVQDDDRVDVAVVEEARYVGNGGLRVYVWGELER